MEYRSTRGQSLHGFADVLVGGLAADGGLFVPSSLPSLPDLPTEFAPAAAAVLEQFIEPDPLATEIGGLATDVYSRFRHPEVAPLREMEDRRYLLDLFWGPTLSFKDYALQIVGTMFDRVLARSSERIIVLGATSGDTGSAAIAGCRGRAAMDIVILYPDGAVSDVQRRQMTTVPDANVHVVAVEGTFDDCQHMVKTAFDQLRHRYSLAAFNSINWARIAAQTAYYAFIAQRFDTPVDFVVPTGNFGNILSAHTARRMGAPIGRLVVANNANHGISDLIATGSLQPTAVTPSYAPAMDVQIPSNLERYLFEAVDEDPEAVVALQEDLSAKGRLDLPPDVHARLRSDFEAAWRPDVDIVETIRKVHADTGVVIDPHTAVAWSVAAEEPTDRPTVVVATAHPAKFPEVVHQATGSWPSLPDEVATAISGPERSTSIAADMDALIGVLDRVAG